MRPAAREDRRRFLRLAALAALGWQAAPAWADHDAPEPPRRLSFHNTHTGEDLDVVYWAEGDYVDAGLAAIDKILRDHRTGEVKPMDRRLLDLLFALRARLRTTRPFHVISGYRSPASNELLRGRGKQSGVASKSQHMKAKAVDVRVPGRNLDVVRAAAVALRAGGVGYYAVSDFVHVDVDRVRYW